jgi:hypothetical protein
MIMLEPVAAIVLGDVDCACVPTGAANDLAARRASAERFARTARRVRETTPGPGLKQAIVPPEAAEGIRLL